MNIQIVIEMEDSSEFEPQAYVVDNKKIIISLKKKLQANNPSDYYREFNDSGLE